MTSEPDGTDESAVEATAPGPTSESGPARDPESDPADEFDRLVDAAIDSIPENFRDRLDSVAIIVEEEPSADDLRRSGAAGLLGLYTGVPRTAWGASDMAFPSRIAIYRGPHLRQFGTGPNLAAGVMETVRHEVAHHFGISDARLDELWKHPRR